MVILSNNLAGVLGDVEAVSFCVGQSRKNQVALMGLACCTCCVFLLFGLTSIFTVAFVLLAVWQALRTFVVRTKFGAERLEHRDIRGNWRAAEYSGLLVQSDPGEALVISGDDLTGRNLTVKISKMDGDLDQVKEFLRKQVG